MSCANYWSGFSYNGSHNMTPQYFVKKWGDSNKCDVVTYESSYNIYTADDYKRCICDLWGDGESSCPAVHAHDDEDCDGENGEGCIDPCDIDPDHPDCQELDECDFPLADGICPELCTFNGSDDDNCFDPCSIDPFHPDCMGDQICSIDPTHPECVFCSLSPDDPTCKNSCHLFPDDADCIDICEIDADHPVC
jgi:hypothetical protein